MKRIFFWLDAFLTIVFTMSAQQPSPLTRDGNFDVIIRNGTVYDGTGAEPRKADVAIRGDRIASVGDLKSAKANTVIDAKGLAVAPGFINMSPPEPCQKTDRQLVSQCLLRSRHFSATDPFVPMSR